MIANTPIRHVRFAPPPPTRPAPTIHTTANHRIRYTVGRWHYLGGLLFNADN